jgi:hypothetical protein
MRRNSDCALPRDLRKDGRRVDILISIRDPESHGACRYIRRNALRLLRPTEFAAISRWVAGLEKASRYLGSASERLGDLDIMLPLFISQLALCTSRGDKKNHKEHSHGLVPGLRSNE